MFTWDPAKDMWCNTLSCEDPPWISSHWFPKGWVMFRGSKPEQTARRSSDYFILIPPHDCCCGNVCGVLGRAPCALFGCLEDPCGLFNDAFRSSFILVIHNLVIPYTYSHSYFLFFFNPDSPYLEKNHVVWSLCLTNLNVIQSRGMFVNEQWGRYQTGRYMAIGKAWIKQYVLQMHALKKLNLMNYFTIYCLIIQYHSAILREIYLKKYLDTFGHLKTRFSFINYIRIFFYSI